jgi:hypothetical protein
MSFSTQRGQEQNKEKSKEKNEKCKQGHHSWEYRQSVTYSLGYLSCDDVVKGN